jgi:hypothetical protein
MAKADIKDVALDAGIVVAGGGLAVKYLVPSLTGLPVVGDVVKMFPVEVFGLGLHVFIFGGVALYLYRTFMK